MFFTVLGLVAGIVETALGFALVKVGDRAEFRDVRRARTLLRTLGFVTGLLGALEVGESVVELGFDYGDDVNDD